MNTYIKSGSAGLIDEPVIEIAGTGHRFFNNNIDELKALVKNVLLRLSKSCRVIVCTCYASGADLLIAECANELALPTKAVLPFDLETHVRMIRKDSIACGYKFDSEDELRLRQLLEKTTECTVKADKDHPYLAASRYLAETCDKLIALWDGKKLPLIDPKTGKQINLGGTYHTISMAHDRGLKPNEDIFIIPCQR